MAFLETKIGKCNPRSGLPRAVVFRAAHGIRSFDSVSAWMMIRQGPIDSTTWCRSEGPNENGIRARYSRSAGELPERSLRWESVHGGDAEEIDGFHMNT